MPVTYHRSELSPPLPHEGVRVEAPAQVELDRAPSCPVAGCFRVRHDELHELETHPLRAITLVTRSPAPRAWSPGDGELLFADDVVHDHEHVHGFFGLDLFAVGLLPRAPGRVWLSVSMLHHFAPPRAVDLVVRGVGGAE